MNQLLDMATGYARLLQHVGDTSEDRLSVITARRQDLAGDKASVSGEEDKVGKGAADIDAEPTHKISIHSLIARTVFGLAYRI
jgi:hypothetical protein